MRQRHVGAGALVILLGLGGLAGCSDEPAPDIADPTSGATSTSTAAPISEPPTTQSTTEPEKESAQAFIRRWATVERAMQNSGDTSAYRALSDGCEGCDSLAAIVEGYYAAGGSVSWGGWKILRITRFDPSQREYKVTVDSAVTTYVPAAGEPPKRLTGGPADWIVELRREGTSWVVTDKDRLVG